MKRFIDLDLERFMDPPYFDMSQKFMEICGGNRLLANFWLNNVTQHSDPGRYKWKCNLEIIFQEYPDLVGWVPDESLMGKGGYGGKVRLVAGRRSDYVTAVGMEGFGKWFPGFDAQRDVRWLDCGHWVQAEKPKEFVESIKGFIG